MDKYEYKLRADEIKSLIQEKRYKEAVTIADTIDWKNVRNSVMLCTISDLYKVCKRYEDSREVLLIAYDRNPGGRMIVYSLCELSIKLGDIVNAIEYFKEFARLAPYDTGKFVLKYKLFSAQGVGIEERIAVLEELQRRECKEKWMYELANLYHIAGYGEQCVEECNQIIIYFGEGKYVIKALELMALHKPLSEEHEFLYRRLTSPIATDIVIDSLDVSQYNPDDLQKELANNLKEVLGEEPEKEANVVKEEVFFVEEPAEVTAEPVTAEAEVITEKPYLGEEDLAASDTADVAVSVTHEEEKEQEVQEPEVTFETTIFKPIVINENPDEEATKVIDHVAVNRALESEKPAQAEEPKREAMHIAPPSEIDFKGTTIEPKKSSSWDIHEISLGNQNSEAIKYPTYDDMVSVEGDGQISIVMPEQEQIDKQITGQISIDDVLLEWERMKDESDRRWEAEVKKRVLSQTTDLLKSFEEASKNGLLEELEITVAGGAKVVLTPEEQQALLNGENPDALNFSPEDMETEAEPEYEEEIILIEDPIEEIEESAEEINEEIVEEATEEATEEVIEEGPTPEELHFDRTPFLSDKKEDDEIDEVTDDTAVLPNLENLDYLMQYAAAIEEHEVAEKVIFGAAEILANESSEQAPQEVVEEVTEEVVEEAAEEVAEEVIEEVVEETAEEVAEEVTEEVVEETAEEVAEEVTEEVVEETAEEVAEEATEEVVEETIEEAVEETTEETVEEVAEDTTEEVTEEVNYGLLTASQYARFEDFVQTEGVDEQIIEALDKFSMDGATGNVIVGSDDSDGAVEFAKALITEIAESGVITGKVAKIKAATLNSKDVKATIEALNEGAIIVQDIGDLKPETISAMTESICSPDFKIIVVLTANQRIKHKFIMDNQDIMSHFNVSVDITSLDDRELVEYAQKYALEQEHAIDEMGLLALHRRIEEAQTNAHAVRISEVRGIVDEAIEHVSKKNVGHFFDIIVGKRYDDNDMIVLREKDFE